MTFLSISENISSTPTVARPLETFRSLPEVCEQDASEPIYTRSNVSEGVAARLGALAPD